MSSRTRILLQLAAVLSVLALAAWLFITLGAFQEDSGPRTLTFRVDASGGYANITFEAGDQKITESTTVTTPWERRVVVARGKQVYLTASNPSQTGSISCAIRLDGQVWKNEKIDTPKDGVACAGIVP